MSLAVLLSLLAAPVAHATAQVANLLLIDGEPHALWSRPLPGMPHRAERFREKGWSQTTACRTGYVTVWSIEQNQLWFLGTRDCHRNKTLSAGEVLEAVTDERIVADWYSGTLVLPQGELINYVHGGWASLYSQEHRIVIERGQVITESIEQLVPPGFAGLEDMWLPELLLLPRDLAEARGTLDKIGDQRWLKYQSTQPDRLIRIRAPVAQVAEGVDVPALLSAALTDQLGTRGSQQHHDLESRGMIAWEDRPESGGVLVRTFAWAHRDQLYLFELHLPQSAADERETFTTQLGRPLP